MPLYEFICRDCRSSFEKLMQASRRDEAECPACGSQRTARHISLTAPAQVKSGASASPMPAQGCGAPSCCGGMCGMPGME